MADNYYDEIEFEDLTFDKKMGIYTYPCPCGDNFQIALDDMKDGWDVGVCPSCSLQIKVIFGPVSSFSETRKTTCGVANEKIG